MTELERIELASLLTERTLSSFQRRKRRYEAAKASGTTPGEALEREQRGLPLSREQFCLTHLGFLPEEWPAHCREYEERRKAWGLPQLSEPGLSAGENG